MAHMTLDELKAQNAAAQAHQQQDSNPAETDGSPVDDPVLDDDGQTDDDQQQQTVPDWMLSDDQASPEAEGSKVPVQTLISVRRKLKGPRIRPGQ